MKKVLLPFLLLFLASCAEEEKKPDPAVTSFTVDSAFAAQQQTLGDKTKTDTTKSMALPAVEMGDIILQNRSDDNAKLLGTLTGSKYNNMGIIFQRPKDNLLMVMSVSDSVKVFPLTEWVSAGDGQHVALIRIKNAAAYFNERHTDQLKTELKSLRGIPCDPYLDWTDTQLYCSEFVYKAYHNALGVVLCTPAKFSSLKYYDPAVKKTFYNKYKGGQFPADMDVVSPDQIYHSTAVDIIFER